MRSLTTAIVLGLGSMIASVASARPSHGPDDWPRPTPPSEMPAAGDTLPLSPDYWGKQKWLYDAPSENDAAGKVVIHWFCPPKVQACTDDLARIITLRDNGKVYIVAYIDGNASLREEARSDPRERGRRQGHGRVRPGRHQADEEARREARPDVDRRPTSTARSSWSRPTATPPRSTRATRRSTRSIGAIKEFTTSHEGPATVKAGDKFTLAFKVQLAQLAEVLAEARRRSSTSRSRRTSSATRRRSRATSSRSRADADRARSTAPRPTASTRRAARSGSATTSPGGSRASATDGANWKFEST